jgi:hypothetical protein
VPAEVLGKGESLPANPAILLASNGFNSSNGRIGTIDLGIANSSIFASPTATFDPTTGVFASAFTASFTGNTVSGDAPWQILRIPGDRPALVNFRGIPDVPAGEPGQPISLQIPSNAFAQSGSATEVALSATLADGRPLPASLRFNPQNGRFDGALPDESTDDLVIRVVARDTQGRAANAIFRIKAGQGRESRLGNERGRSGLSEQLRGARASAR